MEPATTRFPSPGLLKSYFSVRRRRCGRDYDSFLLDRIDDRMASYGEFQRHFSENVVGQIPKEKSIGTMALLQPDDPRHILPNHIAISGLPPLHAVRRTKAEKPYSHQRGPNEGSPRSRPPRHRLALSGRALF